jgi:hypothetical protein
MSLMGLVRSLAFLAIAWVIAALGLGVLGTRVNPSVDEGRFYIPQPALHDAVAADWTTGRDPVLFDQVTGQSQVMSVPGEDRWTLLSIAPWRDSKGRLEAVGRWINPNKSGFGGLGRFRLEDKKVIDRVSLDILPTGRPCWVPDHPGVMIFPAGNGRLYRYEFTRHDEESETADQEESKDSLTQSKELVPLVWREPEPGEGDVFVFDPFWSHDSRLKGFIFVAMSRQISTGSRKAYEYQSLWWLKVSPRGDEVLGSGPLTRPDQKTVKSERTTERMPNIAIDGNGTMTLVYLVHSSGEKASRLHAVELEIDSQTGTPRIRANSQGPNTRDLGDGVLPAPLIVSADGKSVYASRASEKSVRFSLADRR